MKYILHSVYGIVKDFIHIFNGIDINNILLVFENKDKRSQKCGILFDGFINVSCIVIAAVLADRHQRRKSGQLLHMLETLQDHYALLNHWLELKNEGKSVAQYFEEMEYQHIAVYGMAELGNRLMEDLEGSPIQVDYGIDKDAACSIARIEEVYSPEDMLPKTDVIIVTPYSAFEDIKKMLEKKVTCPVISLEEVVWSV